MRNIIILLLSGITFNTWSQTVGGNLSTTSGGQSKQVQPKIMVIPFTKEGQDIRTILEADVNKRIAVTVVKEYFDSRGFTTVDFTAKLKAALTNNAFSSENQSDFKAAIVQMSGADIYVDVEVDEASMQNARKARVIMTAYYIGTGNSLANKVCESPGSQADFGRLVKMAVEACADDFLNVMQKKFDDIVENGQSVYIQIGLDAGTRYDMSSEVGADGLPLSDVIEMWIEKNAYKNQYNIQGTTNKIIIFDDVRIPLRDQVTGNNYNPKKFSLEIWKFFKDLGISVGKEEIGNRLIFTIK